MFVLFKMMLNISLVMFKYTLTLKYNIFTDLFPFLSRRLAQSKLDSGNDLLCVMLRKMYKTLMLSY